MPEEESFAVIVKIMQDYRMREMFKPSMAELGLCMYQLDTLVQEHIPDLYVHFQSQSIHTNLYASSWFLTLFATSLPLNISCRLVQSTLSNLLNSRKKIKPILVLNEKMYHIIITNTIKPRMLTDNYFFCINMMKMINCAKDL